MKALPLWQPYASLILVGAKRIETRDYPPKRIGLNVGQRIAIHACKTRQDLDLCLTDPFHQYLPNPDQLPLGALICTCTIHAADRVTDDRARALKQRHPHEHTFGDYRPGRWAWTLTDITPLPKPVPYTGSQGAFDVPDRLLGHQAALQVDCPYPAQHAQHHHPHPATGRLVCHLCHTPANVLTATQETPA